MAGSLIRIPAPTFQSLLSIPHQPGQQAHESKDDQALQDAVIDVVVDIVAGEAIRRDRRRLPLIAIERVVRVAVGRGLQGLVVGRRVGFEEVLDEFGEGEGFARRWKKRKSLV